jgi:hypothetical protein
MSNQIYTSIRPSCDDNLITYFTLLLCRISLERVERFTFAVHNPDDEDDDDDDDDDFFSAPQPDSLN